ncbi:MAG: hypothetical protein COB15_09635 [Flavobacteriales bacterium]|nr:MAG: hypothetical protein COB15_09635 [Flavobacteriales bacterium]
MRHAGKTAEAKRIADEHRKKGLTVLELKAADLKNTPKPKLRGTRIDNVSIYYNLFGEYPE